MDPFPADLFRPGKLNMGERWRGGSERQDENGSRGGEPPRPKARFRDVEEILQTTNTAHTTYHVPPGERTATWTLIGQPGSELN